LDWHFIAHGHRSQNANCCVYSAETLHKTSAEVEAVAGFARHEIADLVDCSWEAYLDYCDSLEYGEYETAQEDILDALDYLDEAHETALTMPDTKERKRLLGHLSSSVRFMERAEAREAWSE